MNTLQYFGMLYVDWAESGYYAYLIVLVAALITGLVHKTEYRLPRSTYFLNISLVTFGSGLIQAIWLFSLEATAGGYVWILALIDFLSWAAAGYFLVMFGKARSNDAFGHSRYAALAFIPLANFVLLFKGPKDTVFQTSGSGLTVGAPAVVIGLIAFGIGRGSAPGLEQAVLQKVNEFAGTQTATDIGKAYFEFYLKRDGLDGGLQYLASLDSVGPIDGVTDLSSITAQNGVLTYDFTINDNSITGLNPEWASNVQAGNCITYTDAINAGATIKYLYHTQSRVLADIQSHSSSCR